MTQDEERRAESRPKMAIKLRMDSANSEHIKVSVFMGRDKDHFSHAGQLTLYPHEWGMFQEIMRLGCVGKRVDFQVQYLEDQ